MADRPTSAVTTAPTSSNPDADRSASEESDGAPPPIFAAGSTPEERPPPVPIKIVVGGGFGAGKTTGISVLSEIEPVVTEAAMTARSVHLDVAPAGSRKESTTVAMDFGRLTLDDSLVLYLFGTPGQQRFGFMWPTLCAGALGAIVMVDSSRIADCFVAIDYFEMRRIPFVVAVNQFDGRDNLPLADVRAATDVDPDIPVLGVDARDRESMRRVALRLLDLILARAREPQTAGTT